MPEQKKDATLSDLLKKAELASSITGRLPSDVENLIFFYNDQLEAGNPDPLLAQEIQTLLEPYIRRNALINEYRQDPCRPYPENSEFSGRILLGETIEGHTIYRLSPEFIGRSGGILCLGLPGAGKTSLTHFIKNGLQYTSSKM